MEISLARRQNQCQRQRSAIAARTDHAVNRHDRYWNFSHARQPIWGNQALQRLLHTRVIQAKLTMNEPRDRYEQEADRVAEHLVQMEDASAPSPGTDFTNKLMAAASVTQVHGDMAGNVSKDAESRISRMNGRGQPLPREARCFFKERLGADFSDVRIHTDSNAIQISRDINARAFTIGNNIGFNSGEYNFKTLSGKHLLAHELTHTVQQSNVIHTKIQREVDWTFIADKEGGNRTIGYVPDSKGSNSGVTIDTGFDIGQHNVHDLENIGLDKALIEKLTPYLQLTGSKAKDKLSSMPLNITVPESESIYQAAKSSSLEKLKNDYDAASIVPFDALPSEAQTVIASVAFQYGNLAKKTPSFWEFGIKQDWRGSEELLRNFKDRYPARRNSEADLFLDLFLKEAILKGFEP